MLFLRYVTRFTPRVVLSNMVILDAFLCLGFDADVISRFSGLLEIDYYFVAPLRIVTPDRFRSHVTFYFGVPYFRHKRLSSLYDYAIQAIEFITRY